MPLIVVEGTRHEADDFDLRGDVLEALWAMEDRHFWHRARNAWILGALRRRGLPPPATFLEVGCGGGAVVRALHRAGYRVTGVDTAEHLVRKAHERCPEATLVAADIGRLPEEAGREFAGLGLFDVVEHLDRPEGLLAASLAWVRPGGLVVLTAPALGELHSAVDDLSGHKRRYEVGELGALLSRCGLADVEEHGIFRASLSILRRFRRAASARPARDLSPDESRALMLANFRVPSPPVDRAMGLLCALERAWGLGRGRGKPGGTLLAVGRKP